MVIWYITIFFAAIGMFATTWKFGEWLSLRKAARFAARRESWREIEFRLPGDRDPAGR
jgi:hypothetical protein